MDNNQIYGRHTAVRPSDSLASGMAIDRWEHDLEAPSTGELSAFLEDYEDQLAALIPTQLVKPPRVRRNKRVSITKIISAVIREVDYIARTLDDLPDIYGF